MVGDVLPSGDGRPYKVNVFFLGKEVPSCLKLLEQEGMAERAPRGPVPKTGLFLRTPSGWTPRPVRGVCTRRGSLPTDARRRAPCQREGRGRVVASTGQATRETAPDLQAPEGARAQPSLADQEGPACRHPDSGLPARRTRRRQTFVVPATLRVALCWRRAGRAARPPTP